MELEEIIEKYKGQTPGEITAYKRLEKNKEELLEYILILTESKYRESTNCVLNLLIISEKGFAISHYPVYSGAKDTEKQKVYDVYNSIRSVSDFSKLGDSSREKKKR